MENIESPLSPLSPTSPSSHPSRNSQASLSDRINAATRSAHARLNRQIIANFPLVLPPHSTDPSVYASGLAYIAPIYITFEALWSDVVAGEKADPLKNGAAAEENSPGRREDVEEGDETRRQTLRPTNGETSSSAWSVLKDLYILDLLRSARLRRDIRALCQVPAYDLDAHLEHLTTKGPLATFKSHIKAAITAKPHVVLSYAWVMYMALFSGGRYLRAALEEPGVSFWQQKASLLSANSGPTTTQQQQSAASKSGQKQSHGKIPDQPSDPVLRTMEGLQFWNFAGDEDGTDIKDAFKSTFKQADDALSVSEQDDVIAEAQYIFDAMLLLVDHLEVRGISTAVGAEAADQTMVNVATNVVTGFSDSLYKGAEYVLKPLGLGQLLTSAGRVMSTAKLDPPESSLPRGKAA